MLLMLLVMVSFAFKKGNLQDFWESYLSHNTLQYLYLERIK